MAHAWDPVWEDVFSRQAWGKYPGEDLIRFIARNFYKVTDKSALKLLEVGFGTGANLWFMAREGFPVHGIEGSATAIKLAKERLDQEVPEWQGELLQGDILQLPYEDNSFDAVIDNEAIYANSFENAVQMYKEIHRVLKPGALMFSRCFTEQTTGYGSGTALGKHAFLVSEGPMTGKGYTRFTTRECLEELLQPFKVNELQCISRHSDGGDKVSEWIIIASKSA
ncbi:class I SAM-dependent methyltransferase [Shewanella cyperi]|uniref:class I SAM-dependent methyltransferase n=1 Tax=Shewanella cyperi TaxID=2814292 RepID=UPI001A948EE3|nr:class I SAM-dependent methyltransferase [Shewanella cyperi]QSX39720.1 class I SAM-dependent methyltransferase [Shewanella cyperi]